jgi:hypothetical protein
MLILLTIFFHLPSVLLQPIPSAKGRGGDEPGTAMK